MNDPDFLRQVFTGNRHRAFDLLAKFLEPQSRHYALLAGGTSDDFALYDTDTDKTEFRQESFFRYLFQINEPDCFGILDLTSRRTHLFVPYVSDDSQRWNGDRRPLSYYAETYGVDEVLWVHELPLFFSRAEDSIIHVLWGRNSDSGSMTKTFPSWNSDKSPDDEKLNQLLSTAHSVAQAGVEKQYKSGNLTVQWSLLEPCLTNLRVTKSVDEQQLLRLAALLSSKAHVYTMRNVHEGMIELQCEALYKAFSCYHGGCRHMVRPCLSRSRLSPHKYRLTLASVEVDPTVPSFTTAMPVDQTIV